MKTTFLNVGHGETIFIDFSADDQKTGVIRDFGRSRFANNSNTSVSIERLIRIGTHTLSSFDYLDAILSHAHEDHFNGFVKLYKDGKRNFFNNAYIPWLQMNDLNSLGGLLIKYSIFLYKFYPHNYQIVKNAKNWLLAAPIMAGLSNKLWCVSINHQFSCFGKLFKILWPPPTPAYYYENLKKHWDKYLFKNELDENFLNDETEQIMNLLSEFYPKQPEEQNGNELSVEKIENTIKNINSILSKPLVIKQNKKLSSPKSLIDNGYNPTIDNHSLMFEISEDNNKNLFLSDADDKTINEMLEQNKIMNKNYSFIKSGHHGNRGARALKDNNITSNSVISCCGPAHSNWKGPDINYNNISNQLDCTDWHYSNPKWNNKNSFIISNSFFIQK